MSFLGRFLLVLHLLFLWVSSEGDTITGSMVMVVGFWDGLVGMVRLLVYIILPAGGRVFVML